MKILLELPSWLGDAVMTTPAIENLSNQFPNALITFIGEAAPIELFKLHPKRNKCVHIEKNIMKIPLFAKNLGKFDIFFSFRSSKRTTFLKFFINSAKKYQYKRNKYNDEKIHQVEKYNFFISELTKEKSLPEKLKIYGYESRKKLTREYIVISPGANFGSAKRWYPERFAEIAKYFSRDFDIKIIGSKNETEIASSILKNFYLIGGKKIDNLTDKTSIQDLIKIISSSSFFIGCDSGPAHIAASFEIPSIIIFGPTKPNETCQWKNISSFIVKKDLDCQPCMKRTCPLGHHECMKKISSNDLIQLYEEQYLKKNKIKN